MIERFKNLIRPLTRKRSFGRTMVFSLVVGLVLVFSAASAFAAMIPATGAVNRQGTRLFIPDQTGDRIRRLDISNPASVSFVGMLTDTTVGNEDLDGPEQIEISGKYVKDSQKRITDSEGLPVEGEGLAKWPEHADQGYRSR